MKVDKRIVILGAGESGVGAALLAKANGFIPFVSDAGKIKGKYKKILFKNGISHEEGQHSEEFLITADEVIKSPGIPDDIPILEIFHEKDIPVISDIEFAARYTNAKIIAITGTNGKTTTSMLTYYLLKKAGLKVCLAGNVGISFAKEVIENNFDYYVLEVSSFQLDYIREFKPDIGVLLNITPDHLDRYNYNFDKYIRSKFNLLKNMKENDIFIYFGEDVTIQKYLESHTVKPHKLGIALNKIPDINAWVNGKYLKFNLPLKPAHEIKIGKNQLNIQGPHNMINAMASITIAKMLRISDRNLKAALKSFVNVPHRLEKVVEYKKIQFINDSKATNLDAAVKAIQSYSEPIIWIVGGIDKGNNYELIVDLIIKKVKGIICLGIDNSRIIKAFAGHIQNLKETREMKKAVKMAFKMADPGNVILLSPACASFDLFKNYADRGDQFKKAVKKIIDKNK